MIKKYLYKNNSEVIIEAVFYDGTSKSAKDIIELRGHMKGLCNGCDGIYIKELNNGIPIDKNSYIAKFMGVLKVFNESEFEEICEEASKSQIEIQHKIKEASILLQKNGYIVKKLTKSMNKDADDCIECMECGKDKDCSTCACNICIIS